MSALLNVRSIPSGRVVMPQRMRNMMALPEVGRKLMAAINERSGESCRFAGKTNSR
jgi:hypothetical protein